ncbi:hypothetical protein K458DRAFT_392333 [Lentithecium fluviatile CBS 122367]|uniref:Uncharacterized protein n=1 Tax=Lentithecium fluviatile CBS 122367 TaxID=1168545 RepID=A0A6G1IS83_9PLEO|nr:hypothetical protein K458DRAFT_392333 [Lentithecium fluviatile CBS 122367]
MSVGQSNSSSQSGTYGTPNSSQLPAQQGTNGGTSHVQNSRSAQNGTANTSDPPSASTAEFMQLSNDPEILALHDAIASGGQPNGGGETPSDQTGQNGIANTSDPPSASMAEFMLSGDPVFRVFDNTIADGQPNGGDETHPAGENANTVSPDQPTPINLNYYLPEMSVEERQHWQEMWTSGDVAASDFNYPSVYVPPSSDGPNADYNILMGLDPSDQTGQGTSPAAANGFEGSTPNGGLNPTGSHTIAPPPSVREVENDYNHLPSVYLSELLMGTPNEESIAALEPLRHYPEDEAGNATPGEGPTASSQTDQTNIRSGNARSLVDQTAVHMSGLQLETQTDDDSEGEASGTPGETGASSQANRATPRRNRRGVRRVGRLSRMTPEETEAFFREFSD